jgi:hypothetical protein
MAHGRAYNVGSIVLLGLLLQRQLRRHSGKAAVPSDHRTVQPYRYQDTRQPGNHRCPVWQVKESGNAASRDHQEYDHDLKPEWSSEPRLAIAAQTYEGIALRRSPCTRLVY